MKHSKKKIILLSVILCIILLFVIVGVIYMGSLDKAFDTSKTDTLVVSIESGSTTSDIGNILEEKQIIKSEKGFKIYSKLKGFDGKYQAGIYALSPAMKLSEITGIIINGKTNDMTFTIPEGYTIYQIANKLAGDKIINKDAFESLLKTGDFNYSFLKKAQTGKNHLEGYLFPDTYSIKSDATEKEIIDQMLSQFENIFTDEYKAQATKMGYSINDIIVVASIIERESKVDSERAKVASVIYNRIKEGMPLQMCSTVQYVLGKQKESLTDADTQIDSKYNTYTNPGLPPGPICCPGQASIKAALYPDKTDYLYFVVSDKLDGSQKFSSSYSQFLKDKDSYYNALENQ